MGEPQDHADVRLPVEPVFEYAVLTMSGATEVDGVRLDPGSLYLGSGRTELLLRALNDSELLLVGGELFEEEIIMWWNFIGCSHKEIEAARKDWTDSTRFREVTGYAGARLTAPELPPPPETRWSGALTWPD